MSQRFEYFEYFEALARTLSHALDQLSPYWLAQDSLSEALEQHRQGAIATFQAIPRPAPPPAACRRGVGLNTVGLLTDRLTILAIKAWCLRHQHQNPEAAQRLDTTETRDILEALADAAPARGALNAKLTIHKPDIRAYSWAAAVYDLFATNAQIWKAQDCLYGNEPGRSPLLLHTYTHWLPAMNVQRDALIQRCELLYWHPKAARDLQ